MVFISQLIRFARVSSHVDDFNTRNKVLTAKLIRQGYRYHKVRKAFSKFYRRHFDLEIHLTEHGRFHFQGRTTLTHLSCSHPAGT